MVWGAQPIKTLFFESLKSYQMESTVSVDVHNKVCLNLNLLWFVGANLEEP